MAIFHVVDDTLVQPSAARAMADEPRSSELSFSTPFTPIGLNQPLAVMIRHVYTGEFPRKLLLGKRKDMLVTSAIKDVAVFNASARAVNFLRQNVAPNSGFSSPAATEQGTPLVFYTPAVISPSTILTLDITFDEFPDDVFNKVHSVISGLAGLPVFSSCLRVPACSQHDRQDRRSDRTCAI